MTDLKLIYEAGLSAAEKSADILRHYFGNNPRIQKKGAIDLVTQADVESENAIINTIREYFPDHTILAEESGLNTAGSDCRWIIDPLDGTTNFAHALGLFSVSIAFAVHERIKMGIVLNPVTGELFSALENQGASLNGQPISVSSQQEISDCLIVTGFPYDFKASVQPLMTRFRQCLESAQGIRRLGSAALDLCFVACGRFDGFWEQNLKPWDTAAGLLIAREAGATVTDFANHPYSVDMKEILATNGKIHPKMLSLLELKKTE
jgi:myo-inositol-1(or 4)-monophosphatase